VPGTVRSGDGLILMLFVMEKKFAGKRFSVNLRMKIEVDVFADSQIYEAIELLYLMLENNGEVSAHLMESEIEDWGVTNVTNLYWEDVE
jgi:hypothetical protein